MSKNTKYLVDEIFVPGGLPVHTYNPRSDKKIESNIKRSISSKKKLIMVTGLTKSGKTVVTRQGLKGKNIIWCDCGAFNNEEELWSYILSELGEFTDLSVTHTKNKSNKIVGSIRSGVIGFFAWIGFNVERGDSKSEGTQKTISIPPKARVTSILKRKSIPVILDDFHYLDRELQGRVVRALKGPIFDGAPVIFIAIPHRRLDATKVEREMTGRVENIDVPSWDIEELKVIPEKGFSLLNVKVDEKIIDALAKEAFGSPHLMQEFCLELCKMLGVEETSDDLWKMEDVDLKEIFKTVSKNTGKVVFDKLAKGPKQRSDRIKRPLKNGETVDIYEAILLALVDLKPGLSTIQYEQLRESLRNILKDKVPNAQEISRVLSKMNEIALNDESSTPVMDWEKEENKLHITDPFFAFYLKWGQIENAA